MGAVALVSQPCRWRSAIGKSLVASVTIVTNGEMYPPHYLSENLLTNLVTPVTNVTNVEDAEPSHAFKISQNVL